MQERRELLPRSSKPLTPVATQRQRQSHPGKKRAELLQELPLLLASDGAMATRATPRTTALVQDGYQVDGSRDFSFGCRNSGPQLQQWRLFIVKTVGTMIQQTSVALDETCLPATGGISTRPPVCDTARHLNDKPTLELRVRLRD